MTLKQVMALPGDVLQSRVAELRGFTNLKSFSYDNGDKIVGLWGVHPGQMGHHRGVVPRFDLDDMHRVEKWLFESGRAADYENALHRVMRASSTTEATKVTEEEQGVRHAYFGETIAGKFTATSGPLCGAVDDNPPTILCNRVPENLCPICRALWKFQSLAGI